MSLAEHHIFSELLPLLIVICDSQARGLVGSSTENTSMKKLAIGCGVVLLLCGIVAAGVGFYVYRQASRMFTQFAELKNISELERGIRAPGPYTPPSSGELTSVQLERLLRVQTQVRERLGQRFTQIEQRYKSLTEKEHATIADAPALMAAYKDLAEAWMAAKRSQIDALNNTGLSLEDTAGFAIRPIARWARRSSISTSPRSSSRSARDR